MLLTDGACECAAEINKLPTPLARSLARPLSLSLSLSWGPPLSLFLSLSLAPSLSLPPCLSESLETPLLEFQLQHSHKRGGADGLKATWAKQKHSAKKRGTTNHKKNPPISSTMLSSRLRKAPKPFIVCCGRMLEPHRRPNHKPIPVQPCALAAPWADLTQTIQ